ncbi:hypothetical protein Hanom_Chr01g00037151 [Helianthus anomalus]
MGDDAGDQPQVILKRSRNPSLKPDPNPKGLKKTKLASKPIVLEEETDRVTELSTAGGLLENLSAHLHGDKTKVVADTEMIDPLALKKTGLSPSGKPRTEVDSNVSRPSPQQFDGGDNASSYPLWYETKAMFICRELGLSDTMDVDYAQALEKYVPDWSLANKDRIIDALFAKMSLFHISTPAEHFYYCRMSGPKLGNALKLNQAQSNSLVVETYKWWVEAESNCQVSSLRAQVDRLKEQVLETQEINKASQVFSAVAFEARDKAAQDLESLKLRFEALEKKLSEVEEGSISKQKKIQSSYDQLLADYLCLVNGAFSNIFLFCPYC